VLGVDVALGGVLGVVVTVWSQHMTVAIGNSLKSEPLRPSLLTRGVELFVGAVVGGVTGWMFQQSNSVVDRSLLVVVSLLLLAQGPLDLRTRRLSRPLTAIGFVVVLSIVVVDAVATATKSRALLAMLLCVVVVAGFGVLHRISSRSLGLGDVLLVGPLSLAIGYVSPLSLPTWLLVASVSGAMHGVMGRTLRKSTTIPFGPHLLGAAWLTLVVGV
jgi:Flp pilus assembly protein protease CpaA